MQLTGKASKKGTFIVKVVNITMSNAEQTTYQEYRINHEWSSPVIIKPVYDYSKTDDGKLFGCGPVDLNNDLFGFVIASTNTDYQDKHKLMEYYQEAQDFVAELNKLIGETN
jgi:hypothetical protein